MPLFLEESREREAVANRVLRRELLVELDLDLLMRFRLGHGARRRSLDLSRFRRSHISGGGEARGLADLAAVAPLVVGDEVSPFEDVEGAEDSMGESLATQDEVFGGDDPRLDLAMGSLESRERRGERHPIARPRMRRCAES